MSFEFTYVAPSDSMMSIVGSGRSRRPRQYTRSNDSSRVAAVRRPSDPLPNTSADSGSQWNADRLAYACSIAFSAIEAGSTRNPHSASAGGISTRNSAGLVKYSDMNPCAPTMPRSWYSPSGAMSGSPRAKYSFAPFGGRRTVGTTTSPTSNGVSFGSSITPTASWPNTMWSSPAGVPPWPPAMTSWSVPSTPTRRVRTSASPGAGSGRGFSVTTGSSAPS